jgi:hypothetical protein
MPDYRGHLAGGLFFGVMGLVGAVLLGWTHTWWAMIVVPLPIVVIPLFMQTQGLVLHFAPFYAAFVLGYFSHLILDGEFR